jgi:hypothetical protein
LQAHAGDAPRCEGLHAACELIVGGPSIDPVLSGRNERPALQLGAEIVERHDAASAV